MEYRAIGTSGSTKVVYGLSLSEIARELATPFNEEQAWGVCHQCSVKLSCLPSERVPPLQPNNVVVTAEGKVEIMTASDDKIFQHGSRELVYELGVLVYSLLDYGLAEDEERDLSGPLEALIGWMTLDRGSVNSEGDQMEHYFKVIKMCECRLKDVTNPSAYYHSVCRALLDMALLIRKAKEEDSSEAAVFHEIRSCWQEVMCEVERGVTLKKISDRHQMLRCSPPALSDFEKLMLAISNFDHSRLKPPSIKDDVCHYCGAAGETGCPHQLAQDSISGSPHSVMMLQVKSKPALRSVKGCSAARRASVLTPRERLLLELCTPRTLRSVSLSDISVKSNASGSSSSLLKKKLTPSDAFVKELKSKDIEFTARGTVGCVLQQYDLNAGIGCPQSTSTTRKKLVPSIDFLTELNRGSGAVDEVTMVTVPSERERKKLIPPPTFVEDLENKENVPHRVTSTMSMSKGSVLQVSATRDGDGLINDLSDAPERKKLTPPKSFLEDLMMESGSPRHELKRSTSVGSSLCEEITVIFMSPPHLSADTSGQESSTLVGGIVLVVSHPQQLRGCMEVSLTFSEIVHIRRTVTEAELSSLQEEDDQLFNLISSNKVCFVCRQRLSVALFSHHKQCLVCERTVCSRCYNSVETLDLNGHQMTRKAAICISCENFLCTFVIP